MFALIPQDKANHQVYGARIATAVAIGVMVTCAAAFPSTVNGTRVAMLYAAMAGAGAAIGAGLVKEILDKRANEAAAEFDLPPTNSVDKADVVATLVGGVTTMLPLLIGWLLIAVTK